jgi:cysteinyl-tRNA synthetase
MDFVLWKPSTPEEPGWDSPWGRGRPGWHIECSAMSGALLGETFDIHGGGVDLVFPHHENEIAQSRCAFHTPVMANYWMHNGFLMVEGEKMAKSLGNFITIRELTSTRKFGSNMWHGYVLRLAMLMTQYRQPIDWTVERLVQARSILKEWIDTAIGADGGSVSSELVAALADDLNTPEAISVLHALHKEARKFNYEAASQLNASLRFLGIWNGEKTSDVYGYGYVVTSGPSQWDIEPLVSQRNAARARKDFKEADRIRDQLLKMGVVLKDSKDGTTWEIAR